MIRALLLRAFSAANRRKFERVFDSGGDPFRYSALRFEQKRFDLMTRMLQEHRPGTTTTSTALFHNAVELGCAEGAFTERLAPLCGRLSAVDISAKALQGASGRLAGDALRSRILLIHDDVTRWPLPAPCDLIVVSEILYYLGERNDLLRVLGLSSGVLDLMLRRLAGALAPGGLLLLAHSHGAGARALRESYRRSLESLGLELLREEEVPPTGEPGTDHCLLSLLRKP